MLITLPLTPYQIRKDEEFVNFDDFLSEIDDRKESEEGKNVFKTNVSSQNKREKEEGATVAASHLPFPAGSFVVSSGRFRQRSSMETFKPSAGKLH
jgi:hypothetical protein